MNAKPCCPICKREISKALDASVPLPFCSSRCKLLDLGNWLDERYRVPGPSVAMMDDDDEGQLLS